MKFPSPPRGLKALPWRIPILFYQVGLGWLLKGRFLLLEHQGRKSGKPRRAVLEIVESQPAAGRYYVVSGFGTRSDWYQNITAEPLVNIQVGRQRFKAQASRLPADRAEEFLVRYWKIHPGSL